MPSVSRKPTVTLLREELSACLKEREDDSITLEDEAACDINPAGQSPVDALLEYIRGERDMTGLSPGDLMRFGHYCHLDFHRMLALVVKGEWEWYAAQRLPAGKCIEDFVSEGLEKVRELSSGFSL